ncbi:unnamed protein product [Musa banksii]
MIIGFHGRSGWYIDSVSVHALKGKVPSTYGHANDSKRFEEKIIGFSMLTLCEHNIFQVTYGLIKEPTPSRPGPWGGDGGKPWDDGVYSGAKQVHITRGDAINSVQIEYDRSGQSVWSARHGSSGETSHQVKIDYPNEILNCTSGYTAPSTMATGSRS